MLDKGVGSGLVYTCGDRNVMNLEQYVCRSCATPTARWLLDYNQSQSKLFTNPEQRKIRTVFRAQHPTEFMVFKCMDGRINFALMSNMPLGIAVLFRTMGGRFEIGWPHLSQALLSHTNYLVREGKRAFMVFTYHYSKGKLERGCKGFHFDKEEAFRATFATSEEARRIFRRCKTAVYPIVVGIETDVDEFIFHGRDGSSLRSLDYEHEGASARLSALAEIYPDLPEQMFRDLYRVFEGNIEHAVERRAANVPIIELDHTERVLCVGRGFDWLHQANTALVVKPFSPTFERDLITAATILRNNLDKGHINPDEGVVVAASARYGEQYTGIEEELAHAKALTMAEITVEAIHRHVPDFDHRYGLLVGATDMTTREYVVRFPEEYATRR